jgi:hypothetical protein
MIKNTHLLLAGALAVTACATPPRFEYGAYEPTLYAYYKKPEMADKFEAALEKAIEKGEKSGRLAPGLYAELGYLRLLQGDQPGAVDMFQKEATSFPEANFFMTTIVRRLNGEENVVAEVTSAETPPAAEAVEMEAEAGLPEAQPDQTQETEVGGGA